MTAFVMGANAIPQIAVYKSNPQLGLKLVIQYHSSSFFNITGMTGLCPSYSIILAPAKIARKLQDVVRLGLTKTKP